MNFNDDDQNDSGFGGDSGGGEDITAILCRQDQQLLIANASQLSTCTYYYPGLDSDEAAKMLKKSPPGTFLIRNSRNDNFLYSLSVQTHRGPTSVRIAYQDGWFSFDCCERTRAAQFRSVLKLIDYYVELARQGVKTYYLDDECKNINSIVILNPLHSQ